MNEHQITNRTTGSDDRPVGGLACVSVVMQ